MRERMIEPRQVLVGLIVALWSLATTPAQAELGVIDGITGTTFNLSAGEARVSTPDGDSLLIWGYGPPGAPQYPGPTLIVNQGDLVTINLTNTDLPRATSIVFPGQGDDAATPADESVTAIGGTCPGASGCPATELLTEEGQLLARVQGEDVVDYDIDAYASRLDEILARKVGMIQELRQQLNAFRQNLKEEEAASSRMTKVPFY